MERSILRPTRRYSCISTVIRKRRHAIIWNKIKMKLYRTYDYKRVRIRLDEWGSMAVRIYNCITNCTREEKLEIWNCLFLCNNVGTPSTQNRASGKGWEISLHGAVTFDSNKYVVVVLLCHSSVVFINWANLWLLK